MKRDCNSQLVASLILSWYTEKVSSGRLPGLTFISYLKYAIWREGVLRITLIREDVLRSYLRAQRILEAAEDKSKRVSSGLMETGEMFV
jgi:hypothetical protein